MTAVIEGFTLSPQQARLWKSRGSGLEAGFRAVCVLRPSAPLDPEALRAALRELVRRNEILRTDFRLVPGMELPLQVIGEPREPSLRKASGEEIEPLIREMAGPGEGTLRAILADLPDGQRLLLSVPALCSDLLGLANLAAEVERCYRSLPQEEPVQYADVASWMTELLENRDAVARKYWQDHGVSPLPAALPFEKPRDAEGFAPKRIELDLPAELALSLGAPPAAILMTAWCLLLQRLTRQRSLVIGAAFDGRRHEELRGALGLFARHLPVAFTGDGSFAEEVRKVAGSLAELAEWQEFFEGPRGEAYFPFCFELSSYGETGLFATERCQSVFDRFDLKLVCHETPAGLRAELFYAADALQGEDAVRVGEWFVALLRDALGRPGAAVDDLEMLTPADREHWHLLNATDFDFGPARTLAERFEEQVDRTPENVAVMFRDRTLTYDELDRAANRLARRLRELGVGPDQRVALCVERSPEMVIGILGILKAGGAYVPVDPAYPEARRSFMLEDARAVVSLTEADLGDPALASLPAERLPSLAGPDNLAYVIYTSGSTGQPKGVMISHRAISNRLLWHQHAFPLAADDRVLQKTPYSFDASVWEIFLPLLTGARLVVAEPGGHQDAAYLVAAVARHEVTVLQLVPSLLAVFLEEPDVRQGCRTLRRLFCGGEAYPADLARRCRDLLEVEICNLYGPTEVSIDASFHAGLAGGDEAVVPIGRPLDNVRIHLLDPAGRHVPPGIPGELFVAGPGLARGYFDRPDLTAERFVPDAFDATPGERLYRTGDRALLAPTGEVHFLGRIDQQVKVRGFRIEPGEIEAVLQQHPAVQGAAVVVREDTPADARLVAYAVPVREAAPKLDEIRGFLASRMPAHMVPAAFVLLDELPRLPNGKVDRAALPAPDAARPDLAKGYVAPRTPAEEVLAAIWAEILGLERVGACDNFFDLGGHSLIATRVVARVREAFRIDLPVRKLFEAPTVSVLAQEVDRAMRADSGARRPPLVPVPRDRDLPLSFAQQRLWFLQQLEPENPAYNLPGALRLSGRLDRDALERSASEILRRHEALRTTFRTVQGDPVQIIHPAAPVRIPVIDFSAVDGDREAKLRSVLSAEALRPFDLESGPLLRLLLVQLGKDEHVLFFNLHHIVSDGWSVGVLVRELTALYGAASQGETATLPELPVQYADFSVWQRQWLQGEVLEAQLGYWRERLAGAPEVMNLAADHPRPAVQTYRGATLGRVVPAGLTESLRRLSRGASATLFTALLAGFKGLLQRHGAGDDIVVGTNVANRDQLEIEGLIGFFVNSLVLRTVLEGEPTFLELVGRVRETVLGAFAHQDLPFDRVVEELQPRRDLSLTPLFQIVFDMDPADKAGGLELPGLRLSPVSLANRSSKFDLNLTVNERPEGLLIAAEYSLDLLEPATVERLLGHFEALLRSATAEPGSPVRDLPMLDEAEVRHLLHEVQGPRRPDYPLEQTLQSLFDRQAASTPDHLAAVCGGEALTYAELHRRAGKLAAALWQAGVRPGRFVGILDERGLDFLTAMLAIFKAGGAYVPFEPGYPEDRLRYMIEDSGISILVTPSRLVGEKLGEVVESIPGLKLIDPAVPGEAPEVRLPPGDPRDPAYMLYTSGSTGLPKGAVIRHDGAVNHIWAQFEALGLGSELRFLQSAPSSSDISVWQFLAPVVIGGCTVITDLDTVSDPRRLLRLLRDEAITLAELVPAVLRGLLDHAAELPPAERALPDLRWMMATGEAVPVDLIRDWFALYPGIPVVNAYGPTEAADDVTQALLMAAPPVEAHSLSIGSPLANFSCYVVDRDLRLVPLGVPGELCIAGIGVGSGYWRKPEKTALSFVPNPFAASPGEVLYRTGDLARWRADGNLEFLGRIDHQVKLRGFRIELGEIEAVLREHPAVREPVVVVRDDGAGKALVAYVAAETEVDSGALRDLLQSRLPGHMVPSAFVVLPALPRTPNGKIDRRALPAPEWNGGANSSSYTPPGTAVEQRLAEIWGEVFRLEQVDVHADFFKLGGHSLLASRVLARVQSAFEVEIPLRRIFENSTISSFARVVEEARRASSPTGTPELRRVERQARRVARLSEEELELAR